MSNLNSDHSPVDDDDLRQLVVVSGGTTVLLNSFRAMRLCGGCCQLPSAVGVLDNDFDNIDDAAFMAEGIVRPEEGLDVHFESHHNHSVRSSLLGSSYDAGSSEPAVGEEFQPPLDMPSIGDELPRQQEVVHVEDVLDLPHCLEEGKVQSPGAVLLTGLLPAADQSDSAAVEAPAPEPHRTMSSAEKTKSEVGVLSGSPVQDATGLQSVPRKPSQTTPPVPSSNSGALPTSGPKDAPPCTEGAVGGEEAPLTNSSPKRDTLAPFTDEQPSVAKDEPKSAASHAHARQSFCASEAMQQVHSSRLILQDIRNFILEEELLRPAAVLENLGRKLHWLSETSKSRNDELSVECATAILELQEEIASDPVVATMIGKWDILRSTLDFFDISHVVRDENVFSRMCSGVTLLDRWSLSYGSIQGVDVMDGDPSQQPLGNTSTGDLSRHRRPSAGRASNVEPSDRSSLQGGRRGKNRLRRKVSGLARGLSGKLSIRSNIRYTDIAETPQVAGNRGQAAVWTEESYKGLSLAYRGESNGSISVKMKGKLDCELFQVLCVVSETSKYSSWIPYVKEAQQIGEMTKCSRLVRLTSEYPWPIRYRESIMYAFGVDMLEESGSVIICARSPPEGNEFLGVPIPPVGKVLRVPCNHLCFILTPTADGAETVMEIFANADPGINLRLLSSILQWIVRKSVKGFYVKISLLCSHFSGSEYENLVAANPNLYEWIKRRIKEYLDGIKQRGIVLAVDDSVTTLRAEDFKEFL